MNERKQILDMLAQGKITVAEAESLLKACEGGSSASDSTTAGSANQALPKFLHIQVDDRDDDDHSKVNIRVPIQLLKAGVKLASFMPQEAKNSVNSALHDKGINIDLTSLKPNELDSLLIQLRDASIDVQTKKETVRIFCD